MLTSGMLKWRGLAAVAALFSLMAVGCVEQVPEQDPGSSPSEPNQTTYTVHVASEGNPVPARLFSTTLVRACVAPDGRLADNQGNGSPLVALGRLDFPGIDSLGASSLGLDGTAQASGIKTTGWEPCSSPNTSVQWLILNLYGPDNKIYDATSYCASVSQNGEDISFDVDTAVNAISDGVTSPCGAQYQISTQIIP